MERRQHGYDPNAPYAGDAPPYADHDGRGGHPHGGKRSKGRLAAYYLLLIVLNALLAVYALYTVGTSMDMDGTAQLAGSSKTITEMFFQILLLLSPLILTVLLNRILYRLFRGRRMFPRGTGLMAVLVILLVQAAVVCTVLRYGRTAGEGGFVPIVTQIESLAEEAP